MGLHKPLVFYYSMLKLEAMSVWKKKSVFLMDCNRSENELHFVLLCAFYRETHTTVLTKITMMDDELAVNTHSQKIN